MPQHADEAPAQAEDGASTPFRGVAAFPVTPADEDGRVDVGALQTLLDRIKRAGMGSICVLGSTGAYPYFSRGERRRAVQAAAECIGGAVPLLVGIGALRTGEARAVARDALDAGAAGGLLAPVSYAPLTDDEVFAHFEAVAGASDLPICIYNNPGTTRFTFSAALIERLACVPRVAAVKNPAPESVAAHLHDLRARVPAAFSLGYSVDWHAAEAMIAGADAWYSVLAGIAPRPCVQIARAAATGDAAEARRLNATLEPMWELFRRHSSFRVVHAAATMLGIRSAVPPRPVLPLPPAAFREIEQALVEIGAG